jgi:hypothetical protein
MMQAQQSMWHMTLSPCEYQHPMTTMLVFVLTLMQVQPLASAVVCHQGL